MNQRIAAIVSALALAAFIAGTSMDVFALMSQSAVKSEMELAAIQYFIDNAHPVSGQVRDRAENFVTTPEWNRVSSVAATGFGFAVLANAAKRGLLDPKVAEDKILRGLRFARDHVPRRKGWFLHFVDWETGSRMWGSEYSTIDTAFFLAGALYAAQIFPDSEIPKITREIYNQADFDDAMTDGGTRPQKRTLSMAYTDEEGYTPAQWDMYAEQKVLLILGLGHPTKPLPAEAWLAWDRSLQKISMGREVMGLNAALFIHQYSQSFIDFRGFQDGFANYHDNARVLSDWHRRLAQNDRRYKTLVEGFWGFSAGESPTGYRVWDATNYQGTVCIGCTVASVMYDPRTILPDLTAWRKGPYRNQIWGRYGFVDSIDLEHNWYSSGVLGITVGPAYMALANLQEDESIWKEFMAVPEIRRGLERASEAGVVNATRKANLGDRPAAPGRLPASTSGTDPVRAAQSD